MVSAEGIVRGAETRGSLRVAAGEHQSGGERQYPRERQFVADGVAELQALPDVGSCDLEVTSLVCDVGEIRKGRGYAIRIAQRAVACECLFEQRSGSVVFATLA